MEPSFCTFRRTKTVWVAAVAAVLVAARWTDAAPQLETVVNELLTIGDQTCRCTLFQNCDQENEVAITPDLISTKHNCKLNYGVKFVCCRDNTSSPVLSVTDKNTLIDSSTKSPECSCVQENLCLEQTAGNGKCTNDEEVCCEKQFIKSENTNTDWLITKDNNNDNNYIPNCGIGIPPPSPTDLEKRISTISEGVSQSYSGQFPWMVAILKTVISNRTGSKIENVFHCGGSLIHPRVVLTAAHCLSNININVIKARMGEWDTQSTSESNEKYEHQDIAVSRIFVHPKHDNGNMFNDVALIELVSDTKYKPHINVICLPDNEINYKFSSCVSTGWGKDGNNQHNHYQNILKKVDLPIVPNDECQKRLRDTILGIHFKLDDSFICAGGEKGEDACSGDGGGPLICVVDGETSKLRKYIQVGIVSWGIGCGDDQVPGVYSSVIFNLKWIKNQLREIIQ